MTDLFWANFTDVDKTFFRGLKATFIMAPREMSEKRLTELVKEYLGKGNVIFGVALEKFINGFDNQPQFRTLSAGPVLDLAKKIEEAKLPYKLHVVHYDQNDVDEVIRAVRPNHVVVVRGSYLHVFHRRPTYGLLQKRGITFELVSPFKDEVEAKDFLHTVGPSLKALLAVRKLSTSVNASAMLESVAVVAKGSFDYSFQTGAVLADGDGESYTLLDATCNEVIPYQTFALHFGNSREENLSPSHDANHYDTIHAEMNLLVQAMNNGVSFAGKTLFINMLPCPSCARTLVKTGLKEVIYQEVHSDGYAVKLFENAGIKTRKVENL